MQIVRARMLLEACEGLEQAVARGIKAEHGVRVFVWSMCVCVFLWSTRMRD